MTLLFLSFDKELNPGPVNTLAASSILHLNIRSIRNKFDFIKDKFLYFNILCFSESRSLSENCYFQIHSINPTIKTGQATVVDYLFI